jgi:hypothetical protein
MFYAALAQNPAETVVMAANANRAPSTRAFTP